jgi:hypothetical protein
MAGFKRRSRRAGKYAAAQYEEGLKHWRRAIRPVVVFLAGPFLLASAVELWLDRAWLPWMAGASFGAFAAIVIFMRETPPRYIEQWNDGAHGERQTEEILEPLERRGWRVVHDIQAERGNYDHVAVGPSGVFLLETKNLLGTAEIRDGVPYLKRRHLPGSPKPQRWIRNQALREAAELKQRISHRTGIRWVQAVVVFWSDFPQEVVEDGSCVYLHGTQLVAWLERSGEELDPPDVEGIAEALDQLAREPATVVAQAAPG